MKRLCFDLEAHFDREFRCGVVFDEQAGAFYEFCEPGELVAVLLSADELISYNGNHWDLQVLERACKDGSAAPLRKTPHHDLWENDPSGLDEVAKKFIPELLPELQHELNLRQERAKERAPTFNGWVPHGHIFNEFDWWLAKATYDVKRTYAIFSALHKNQEQFPTAQSIPDHRR